MNTNLNELPRRILVLDDNPDIHRDFQSVLVGEGGCDALDELEKDLFGDGPTARHDEAYDVDFALQGQEGLKKAEEALSKGQPFMVAFVDMRMPPGWDGLETIEHIWQVDPDIQVVICTAYSDYSWPEIVQRLGKTDRLLLLKKPFDTAEVAQVATALVHKWMLHRQATLRMDDLESMVADRTRDLEEATKGLQQEVVERKEAEQALRESEARYRLLAANIHDVIWTTDMNFQFSYVSPSIERVLGYTVEEMMSQTLQELLTPASAECAFQALAEEMTIENSGQFDPDRRRVMELEMNTKDGSTTWGEQNVVFLRDEEGKPIGMLGVSRDITERKQIEEALQKAYEGMEAIIEERTAELRRANEQLEQDIVERRRAEAELKKSSDELATKNRELEATREELAKLNMRLGEKLDQRTPEVRELLKKNDEFIRRMAGQR